MDLLFKRYASPFPFMDGMILTGRFNEFVRELVHAHNIENEEKIEWEVYLHKVQGMTFSEFHEQIEQDKELQNMTEETKVSNVQTAMNILNNFNPKEGGET